MSLPNGWEQARDASGKVFYIDHIHQTTSWTHPGFVTSPPPPPPPVQADLDGGQFWGLEAESADVQRLLTEFHNADKQLITNTLSVTGDVENAAAALQAMGFTRKPMTSASHARPKPKQLQHDYPMVDIFAEDRNPPPPPINMFDCPDETALAALADFELPKFGTASTSTTEATPSADVFSGFASETVTEPPQRPTLVTTSRAESASARATSVATTSWATVPSTATLSASRSTRSAQPSGLSQYLASTSRPHQQPRTLLPGGRQSLAKGPAITAKGPSLVVGPRVQCQGPSRARGPNPAFRMACNSFAASQPPIASASAI